MVFVLHTLALICAVNWVGQVVLDVVLCGEHLRADAISFADLEASR